MAGKISLGLTIVAFLCFVAFKVGSYQKESELIECQILHVVTEAPEHNQNSRGIPVPYTVAGRELKAETFVLPGVLGQPGQIVKIHQ